MARREQIRRNIVRRIANAVLVAVIAIVFVVFAFVPNTEAIYATTPEASTTEESDESPILSESVQLDDSEDPVATVGLTLLSNTVANTESVESFDYGYDSINFQNLIDSGVLTAEKLESNLPELDPDPLSLIEEDDEVELFEGYDGNAIICNFHGISITVHAFNEVCQMIIHELGVDPKFFPGYDFNKLIQGYAIIILERLGTHGWNTIDEVLLAPNQFISSLSEINQIDPYVPVIRENVMKVLLGEVDPERLNLRIAMSWCYDMDPSVALAKTEKLAGCQIGYHEFFYANYGSFRQLCIYAAEA